MIKKVVCIVLILVVSGCAVREGKETPTQDLSVTRIPVTVAPAATEPLDSTRIPNTATLSPAATPDLSSTRLPTVTRNK